MNDTYAMYLEASIDLDRVAHEGYYGAIYEKVDLKEFIKKIIEKIKEIFDKCYDFLKEKFFKEEYESRRKKLEELQKYKDDALKDVQVKVTEWKEMKDAHRKAQEKIMKAKSIEQIDKIMEEHDKTIWEISQDKVIINAPFFLKMAWTGYSVANLRTVKTYGKDAIKILENNKLGDVIGDGLDTLEEKRAAAMAKISSAYTNTEVKRFQEMTARIDALPNPGEIDHSYREKYFGKYKKKK